MRDAGRRGDAAAKTRGDAATKTRRRRGASRSALRTAGATRNGHAQPPARSRMPPDNHRSGGIRPSRTNRRPPPLRRGRGEPSGFPRGEVEGQRPSDLRHAKHRSGASSSDDGPREPAQACLRVCGCEGGGGETRDAGQRREEATRNGHAQPPARARMPPDNHRSGGIRRSRANRRPRPLRRGRGEPSGFPRGEAEGQRPSDLRHAKHRGGVSSSDDGPREPTQACPASAGAKAERRETRGDGEARRRGGAEVKKRRRGASRSALIRSVVVMVQ
jgi:hypothetical protein